MEMMLDLRLYLPGQEGGEEDRRGRGRHQQEESTEESTTQPDSGNFWVLFIRYFVL